MAPYREPILSKSTAQRK